MTDLIRRAVWLAWCVVAGVLGLILLVVAEILDRRTQRGHRG